MVDLHILRTILDSRPARSEAGVTAIEYGLIAALIAIAIVTALTLVGTKLGTLFTNIAGRDSWIRATKQGST
jgi:pilus assembly protein Flp/PilA